MRVTQLNYDAIKNAYASQLGAQQAEISIAEQRAQKAYTEKAHVLSGVQLGLKMFSLGLNTMQSAYKLKTEADQAEASTALTAKVPEITAYLETAEANGGVWDIDADGHAAMKPDIADGLQGILESGLDPSWTPEVQDQYMAGAVKLTSAWSADAIKADIQQMEASRAKNGLLLVNEAVKADIAAGGGYANTDRAIDAMTWLNEYDRESLRIEKHHASDIGTWNSKVSEYAVAGDYSRGKSYIDSLVASGSITVGSDEYNMLIDALNSQFSTAKKNVSTEAQNYASEALAGGTSPIAMRSTLEAEMEARGYSEEFKEAGRSGADIAQYSAVLSAFQDELGSIADGTMTINDLQSFKKSFQEGGENAYRFDGAPEKRNEFIENVLDPAIENAQETQKAVSEARLQEFKTTCDAISVSGLPASQQVRLMTQAAEGDPTLLVEAKKRRDEILDSITGDEAVKDTINSLVDAYTAIEKKAAGTTWDTAAGFGNRERAINFQYDLMRWIESNPDKATVENLNAFAKQKIASGLGQNIDEMLHAVDTLGEQEGTLITAGARNVANPVFGTFSFNTENLGKAAEALTSPSLGNEIFFNEDTGSWEHTMPEAERLYSEIHTITSSALNDLGIDAYALPMSDAAGNLYPFPIFFDAQKNAYRVDAEGLMVQLDGSDKWNLLMTFEDTDTIGSVAPGLREARQEAVRMSGEPGGIEAAYERTQTGIQDAVSDQRSSLARSTRMTDGKLELNIEGEWKPLDKVSPDEFSDVMSLAEEADKPFAAMPQEGAEGSSGNDAEAGAPEVRLRDLRGTGVQFWYKGAWYTVRAMKRNSEVANAYLEYRRHFYGQIPEEDSAWQS